jgi:hypothetical protein
MELDFLTILFVVLNIPALIAMVVLISRNSKLPTYERISWAVFSLVSPIISLVLFTVKTPRMMKDESRYLG